MSDNHPAPIASRVHRWYADRGVQPRYSPDATIETETIGHKKTDTERQLRWLSKQVAPVVRRLLEWYSEDDLWDIIGGRMDPAAISQLDRGEDSELSEYDDWTTIERRSLGIVSAKQT